MKCPYRTVETVSETICEKKKTIEFAECLKEECPFYGKKVKQFSDAAIRWETVTEPCCRRADYEYSETVPEVR